MPAGIWTPIGMLAATALILVLAYWTTKWVAQRGLGGVQAGSISGGSARFRVLGQIALGRGERLVLVRLEDKCYLLGVTNGSITLLKELEGDEAKSWLAETERQPAPSFLEILGESLRGKK